eukprot:COSAG01_NODE_1411_length_10408_cov_6.595402_3_plen_1024_part_00
MVEKATIAIVVIVLRGPVRLFLSLALALGSMGISMATRPYVGDAEDRTDQFSRVSTFLMVGIGVAMETALVEQDTGLVLLAANSLWLILVFVIQMYSLPLAIAKYIQNFRHKSMWSARDEAAIAALSSRDLLAITPSEYAMASSVQLGHVLERALDLQIVLTDFPASINYLKNSIDDDGLATLHAAVKASSVGSICGLVEGQTSVDWSKQNLGPSDCKIIAVDLGLGRFSAVINEVNVSQNPIGVEGGKALANAIPESSLQCIVIGDKSTRIPLHNSEITSLDVSTQKLGPGEVTVVAAAISTYAVLTRVNVLSNPIGADGADALIEVFEQNTNLRTLLGIDEGVTEVNLSKQNVDPGQAKILAAELKASRAMAVVKKIALSNNFLFGTKAKYSDGSGITHDVDANESGWSMLCDALPGSPVEELDVADIGMGVTGVTSLAKAISAGAVLARVSVLSNPIGTDGADALIDVFEQNTNVRTLLGIEEGVTELNLSEKNVDPGQAKILATELKASRAAAVLASLTVSGNPLTGATCDLVGNWSNIDSDMSGFVALCAVLGKLTQVNLSDCHLGPASMPELAKVFRDADAAVKKVVISHNFVFGSKDKGQWDKTQVHDIDADQSGWSALCDALPGSPVEELDVTDVGMGVTGVTSLAKAMSAGAASVEVVILDGNTIGVPSKVSLKPGAHTGVEIKTGAFATVDGRWAEILQCPGNPEYMNIMWLETATIEAKKKSTFENIVALRTDLVEDYSHIQALGGALSGSEVHTCGLANCKLNPVSLATFVKSVTWETAAVKKIALSNNFLFGSKQIRGRSIHDVDADQSGWSALCDALPGSPVEELDVSDIGMGVNGVTSLAKATSSMLTSLTVSQNAIGGACATSLIDGAKTGVPVKKGVFAAVDGRWGHVNRDPDSDNEVKLIWLDDGSESRFTKSDKLNPVVSSRTDLVEDYSHIELLGQAITRLTHLDISKCNFTPASIKIFTSSVTWETAALAQVDIRGAHVKETDLEALRAAAPEGCKVVWEPP